MKRPSSTAEIFDVPVKAIASAPGCPTNFTARVYSAARFARNACSAPGFEGDAAACAVAVALAGAGSAFFSCCACANAGPTINNVAAVSFVSQARMSFGILFLLRWGFNLQSFAQAVQDRAALLRMKRTSQHWGSLIRSRFTRRVRRFENAKKHGTARADPQRPFARAQNYLA